MTLDGFLTFLTLAVAIYTLATPVAKLRAKLGFAIQLSLAFPAFVLVLYLEFFQWVGQPCPTALGSACDWLVYPADDFITPPQAAFLVALIWMLLAWAIYKYKVSGAGACSLPIISRIVDNLVYEQRFSEVLEFVQPYLPLISKAASRSMCIQKLHDRLALMRSNNSALHYLLHDKDEFEREDRRSPFPKKLRRWAGNLVVLVPAQRQAEASAKDIARVLFGSGDLRHYIVRMKPYFAISLLQLEMDGKDDFSDAYFSDLITDTGSVLYDELKRSQNHCSQKGYKFPESNRLLHFLFADVRTAYNLQVWRPIGEHLLKLLRSDESPDFVAYLNGRGEDFDDECWENPVHAGIFFFELMVTTAAFQGVRWHMWLYYFPLIVDRLEKLYDTSNPQVNTSGEFPTRSARLIYEALANLRGWIHLVSKLPAKSPHRQSVTVAEVQSRKQPWQICSDNENIPVSAAMALGSCMVTIIMSDRIDDKLKGYMYEVIMRAIQALKRDGEEGCYRSFLIRSIVHGGQHQTDLRYRQRLATLWPKVDHVIRSNVDDYDEALKAAMTAD